MLLGSLDYFACADCQSVYSPAAYLVDLLQYLAQFTAWAATLATAREAFLDRRPDVQYTALDCANSEITIPYIDLVNELLEAVIAPPPAGTVIDTLGTSAERRAVPRQVSLAAYGSAGTNGASFPLDLPFDLGFAQTQAYSAGLGVASGTALGRADVLTVLGGPTPSAGLAVTIAAARLGHQHRPCSRSSTAPTVRPWVRWGCAGSMAGNPVTATDPDTRLAVTGAWSDVLAAVPVLLNATGLSLPELYQLLEAEWVTESTVTLRLGVDATTNTITADTEKMTFTGLSVRCPRPREPVPAPAPSHRPVHVEARLGAHRRAGERTRRRLHRPAGRGDHGHGAARAAVPGSPEPVAAARDAGRG